MTYSDSFKKFLLKEADLKSQDPNRYMFFSNIKQIHRQCEILMKMDKDQIETILDSGHDWAEDHMTAATTQIDDVFDFLMNETKPDVNEMSDSGGAGPYDTPNAFGDLGDDTIEMLGFKKVKKKKQNVAESTFMRLSSQLHLK